MKLSMKNIVQPNPNPSTDNWYKIQKKKKGIPFNFKDSHARSNFHHSDFAMWCAFRPKSARKYFSSILIDTFEYSWKYLAIKTGEIPMGSLRDFADDIDAYPWLSKEFDSWGIIFSYLWTYPQPDFEPVFYKTIHRTEKDWLMNESWICNDGITPRVYKFSELAFMDRSIYMISDHFTDEDDINYLDNAQARLVEIGLPNIGTQLIENTAGLGLLFECFGFDENGGITWKELKHNEYLHQRKNILEA